MIKTKERSDTNLWNVPARIIFLQALELHGDTSHDAWTFKNWIFELDLPRD